MSEAQFIKKLTPSVRVSTMDSHRMLTPREAQGRAGTRPPRGGGGQPIKHENPDVQFKAQPIDAVMHGGGSVSINRPPERTVAPGVTRRPGKTSTRTSALSASQIDLCGELAYAHLGTLEDGSTKKAEVTLLLEVLSDMRDDAR